MSSILDALRRIERESGERRGLPFELPPEDDRRPSRNRRRWVGAAGAMAVLGIAIVAFLSIDRNGEEGSHQESPAAEGNAEESAQVALLAPEGSAPTTERAGGSPERGEAAVAEAPVAAADPSGAHETSPNAGTPPAAAEPEAGVPEPGAADPSSEAAVPADAASTPPTPDESPEVRRARQRDQTRARREAVMAQLAERRRERQLQRQRKNEQQAQNARPAAETAPARPWQRVVAPAAEEAAVGPAPDADTAPTALASPPPEAGPSPEGGPSPVAPIAKLDEGAHQAAPSLPTVGTETDTDDAAAPPTEIGGEAAEVPPADAVTEIAAVREEEILRRPPRGAPRVRVSFLLYSEDPGRRRVMLTVNDATDLVTAYEGQRVEALEIARILPDEVHLRYEGKVFAVQPRY